MYLGGIYFMNHKTKDYFPEGAGLLNLSMSTLKELFATIFQLYTL